MNIRNRFLRFPFAVMIAVALSVWLQPAMAADSLTHAQHPMACKKYMREHHGHPGKGLDVVKVVDPCSNHS